MAIPLLHAASLGLGTQTSVRPREQSCAASKAYRDGVVSKEGVARGVAQAEEAAMMLHKHKLVRTICPQLGHLRKHVRKLRRTRG